MTDKKESSVELGIEKHKYIDLELRYAKMRAEFEQTIADLQVQVDSAREVIGHIRNHAKMNRMGAEYGALVDIEETADAWLSVNQKEEK